MRNKLKAALVGLGMTGQNHVRVLSRLDGVDFVAVVDEAGDPANTRGNTTLVDSLEGLPAFGVQLAMVATPISTHELIVTSLLGLGINVLFEKPIADAVSAAKRMLAEANSKQLFAALGHVDRFNPALQQLAYRLSRGDIGEVHQIATRRQGAFPERIGDVGVSRDLASHDIDFTMWLAGSAYQDIFAQSISSGGRGHEDMIVATGRLSNGTIANHVINWLSPMEERAVVGTGEKGTFIADTLTGDLTLHENGVNVHSWEGGNVTRFAFNKKESRHVELEVFREVVLGRKVNHVSFAGGLEILKVTEAILRSAQQNKKIEL